MKHRIFEPHKDLASFVKCYWTLEIPKAETPTKNTIVPDGCIKMIFHYGDNYKHHTLNGDSFILPKSFVIGQLTEPYVVEPMGETATFFVCFHPNGFLPFTTLSIKEFENCAVAFKDMFGEDGHLVSEQVLKANSTLERISFIESFLFKKIASKHSIDQIVKSTVETILTANGQFSVDVLSKKHQIHRRQLARKFSLSIGLSPKQLSKTIRLQAALKMLLIEDVTSLTGLAYENEYYDQAHFIKEFKEFTGLTPKEFYGDDLKMSLIFES
ncbi:helix-turn-helix domain-containing protein [Maribacter hydrothermalis]|uniref:AraC family transcriptional regulator n=1 Tax=Maribacter hydrothermalis TaxID=1836467 RepID=A0A1B7Z130_9FLAO|nr:helix-turn-helix domain-containing protein [Maribacter hydrothermalis]APQ18074.1 AraC family transcriptional regulator [Maribacter hydrothermalis]OBR36419.1 AraC family transcriptional regulator [Maribacter hydrothermalis]